MDAPGGEDATGEGQSWRTGRRAWLGALALGAALSGGLAGGAAWFAGNDAASLLDQRVERGLDAALDSLRLAEAASRLASAITQLESAPTAQRRQAVHPTLHQQAQQLAERLDTLLSQGGAGRGRLAALRPPVMELLNGAEDLNRLVEQRLTVERDLRATLDQVPAKASAFVAALSTLPQGEARGRLEELCRTLASHLLLAGTAPAPSPTARAAFRKTADALLAAVDALPIDAGGPRRADAARHLVETGATGGNVFDLRQEQARLASAAASTANSLRDRAAEVAALAQRVAQAERDALAADRNGALMKLAAAPVGVGLLTALAVFAAGTAAGRVVRPGAADTAEPAETDEAFMDEVPPLHILLAEDEPVNQLVAATMLRRAGHAVTVVGDGRAALEAVRGERYDLVLMDLRMPEMDGAEAVRRIRALPDRARARVRIVMLTASAVPADRDRCRAAGADAVLEKPLRIDDLQPVLERLFAIDAPPMKAEVAEPAPADAPPPDFDAEAIRQMREHLPAERVSALIGSTVNTLRQYHATLADAWAAGDTATVGAMAHKIAGVSGIYGCMALRGVAQGLERAVETGDGDAADLRQRLDAAFAPALATLEAQGASLAGV